MFVDIEPIRQTRLQQLDGNSMPPDLARAFSRSSRPWRSAKGSGLRFRQAVEGCIRIDTTFGEGAFIRAVSRVRAGTPRKVRSRRKLRVPHTAAMGALPPGCSGKGWPPLDATRLRLTAFAKLDLRTEANIDVALYREPLQSALIEKSRQMRSQAKRAFPSAIQFLSPVRLWPTVTLFELSAMRS